MNYESKVLWIIAGGKWEEYVYALMVAYFLVVRIVVP